MLDGIGLVPLNPPNLRSQKGTKARYMYRYVCVWPAQAAILTRKGNLGFPQLTGQACICCKQCFLDRWSKVQKRIWFSSGLTWRSVKPVGAWKKMVPGQKNSTISHSRKPIFLDLFSEFGFLLIFGVKNVLKRKCTNNLRSLIKIAEIGDQIGRNATTKSEVIFLPAA